MGSRKLSKINIAIVGATGAVGDAMREILDQRKFPMGTVKLLASERSAGRTFRIAGRSVRVEVLDDFDFADTQIALFSAGGSVSEIHAPRAIESGCIVIDNTSQFRYDDEIPLVVPEVNPHRIQQGMETRLIANPNCSTIQMVVALKPIYDAVGITRINVATYQAVSGAGTSGVNELAKQTADLLNAKGATAEVHPVQIAFNAIPQIGDFETNGYTKEEMKMVWETTKIFEDDNILVNPTCVRVPVFYGHSEALHIETRDKLSVKHARELLKKAPGVTLLDEQKKGGYPTPVLNATGTDPVFVGRVRDDLSHANGLNLWVVSDNVRKGAALNSVQIAESVATRLS